MRERKQNVNKGFFLSFYESNTEWTNFWIIFMFDICKMCMFCLV